jgi:hypothetical protein
VTTALSNTMRISFSTKRKPCVTTRIIGPLYVSAGPKRKPRVHWLFSGRGWLFGRSLFPKK